MIKKQLENIRIQWRKMWGLPLESWQVQKINDLIFIWLLRYFKYGKFINKNCWEESGEASARSDPSTIQECLNQARDRTVIDWGCVLGER